MTLSNRDEMGFRMLIGREALSQGFLVDSSVSYAGGRPRRAHLTFQEYVGDPNSTAAAWRDGWFRTGDQARLEDGWLEDGWLDVEGRSAEVIRRRGLNISPAQVEEAALALPGVADAAAVGVASS